MPREKVRLTIYLSKLTRREELMDVIVFLTKLILRRRFDVKGDIPEGLIRSQVSSFIQQIKSKV